MRHRGCVNTNVAMMRYFNALKQFEIYKKSVDTAHYEMYYISWVKIGDNYIRKSFVLSYQPSRETSYISKEMYKGKLAERRGRKTKGSSLNIAL